MYLVLICMWLFTVEVEGMQGVIGLHLTPAIEGVMLCNVRSYICTCMYLVLICMWLFTVEVEGMQGVTGLHLTPVKEGVVVGTECH